VCSRDTSTTTTSSSTSSTTSTTSSSSSSTSTTNAKVYITKNTNYGKGHSVLLLLRELQK